MRRRNNESVIIRRHNSGTNVSFIHNWPREFNLGDYLCSPRHYFYFECYSPDITGITDIEIIGGGAFNDLGASKVELAQDRVSIAWGIGRSLQDSSPPMETRELTEHYIACGWRDRDVARIRGELVPCPSAMLPILSLPIGNELGLFLNQNDAVSGRNLMSEFGDICPVFGTNSLSEIEFYRTFLRTDRVITNSYHVAYWSLLSGRQVCLIGYSSKFSSLYDLFELESNTAYYTRGDQQGLFHAVKIAKRDANFVRLEDPTGWRLFCKKRNVDFAESLVSSKLFKRIGIDGNLAAYEARNDEIEYYYPSNPI